MLTHIAISNYTIVSTLEMEFGAGMTVITGETGAGKSIMLDALGLCLGDRADPGTIRQGCARAEISAAFDVAKLPLVGHWLQEHDLLAGDECLLRRVITTEGRSRAYINGTAATLQECSELGVLLIDIHSQHAHQSLLRKSVQRELLDAYAGHLPKARALEQTASDWLRCKRELELLSGSRGEQDARGQLLAYQVEELDQLALESGELGTLEQEQHQLANAEEILRDAHTALELAEAQESGTRQALQLLGGDSHSSAAAGAARELLDSAAIALSEAHGEIQSHIDAVEIDPERLEAVQRRLEVIYDIARKHRILPERVAEQHQKLREELQALAEGDERIVELDGEMTALAERYRVDAARLARSRHAAAKKLLKSSGEVLSSLAMGQCQLDIALTPRDSPDPHPYGSEQVEFLISTNPGAPLRPLGKIASGGELSRISLAIQVVTASTGTVPSMVFDEVDVGIGGAVAEVVGKLLRQLAEKAQVLCVTHLPQVAAQGQHHLLVSKATETASGKAKGPVETRLLQLETEQKVDEIARMLGGVKITEQTLAHAREMLDS